jgi:hypothetical protein
MRVPAPLTNIGCPESAATIALAWPRRSRTSSRRRTRDVIGADDSADADMRLGGMSREADQLLIHSEVGRRAHGGGDDLVALADVSFEV